MSLNLFSSSGPPREEARPGEIRARLAPEWRLAGLRQRLARLPLALKVTLIPVAAVLLLGTALAWQIHHDYLQLEVREVKAQAAYVATLIATTIPLVGWEKPAVIEEVMATAAKTTPMIGTDVITITVLNADGQILARHPNPAFAQRETRHIEASAAVPGSECCRVVVAVSDHHLAYEMGWHTRNLIASAGLTLVLAVVVTWFAMRGIVQPISALVDGIREVKAGTLGSAVPVRSQDEVGELGAAFNEMLGALSQKQQENKQLRRKLFLAQEEERRRVAGELHDNTGQALTSMIAGLAVLRDSNIQTQRVTELLAIATHTLHEVQELSRSLRPTVLQHLGVVPALRQLATRMTKSTSLKVDFSAVGLDESTRLPPLVELALYRIAQEAVSNALRHGRAAAVELLLQHQGCSILVIIEDNGCGFEAQGWRERCLAGAHLGLLSIEERASLLGGTLRIESAPGKGTSLFVRIPLHETSHGQN